MARSRGVAQERLEINGTTYLTIAATAERVGVSRQTLWRWQKDGKIPGGHRYRGRHPVFSEDEVRAISDFANRVEPMGASVTQLRLFNGGVPEEEGK
jgi:excisionase family DNA binding protein